jgi:hypothetical protein
MDLVDLGLLCVEMFATISVLKLALRSMVSGNGQEDSSPSFEELVKEECTKPTI